MAKVMISLPDELLARVDVEAAQRAVSRSALLAGAVRRELDRPNPEVVRAAILRSEERFARAGSFDAAAVVAADRASRR